MPTKEAKNHEERQQNNVDPFAKIGRLRPAEGMRWRLATMLRCSNERFQPAYETAQGAL